jgi:hypothetical protein
MPDAAARAEHARLARFEGSVVAEATRGLDASLGVLSDHLRARAPAWRRDPALAVRERRALARRLRDLRPGIAAIIRGRLSAAELSGGDPGIRRALSRVDAQVRAKAANAAWLVEHIRLNTDRQVQVLAERIMAVGAPAQAAASAVAVRAVDIAGRQAARTERKRRVWVTSLGCCVHCAERAGATAGPGEKFGRRVRLTDRPLPWALGDVEGPPLHGHCRCLAVVETPGLADALARTVAAEAASGSLGFMSSLQRARIARRILRSRVSLNAAMVRRARALAERGGR